MKLKLMLVALMMVGLASMPAQAAPIQVDLELVLAVDVSGSVDSTEYAGQKSGYIAAFNDAAVQSAITSTEGGRIGSIAVTYVEWSSSTQQVQLVEWSLVDSVASAEAFADAIDGTTRAFAGATGVGSAIQYSSGLFSFNDLANAEYEGARQVIDISGDGVNNTGIAPDTARDAALLSGVDAINALAIQSISLVDYFEDNVIGGDGAFSVFASDFEGAFTDAIKDKLVREISGDDPASVPEPATLGLLGLGLLGIMLRRRVVA